MTPTLIPILVIIATAQKARRDKLSGIYDYAQGHGWLIHCVERETSSAHVDTLIRELHPAGVITDGFGAPAVLSAKVRRSLPVVTLDAPNGQTAKDGRSVNHDDAACARLAAQKLDALINGHSAKRVPSTYGPQTVIQRASTRPSLVGDAKIAKIREYIRTHAAVGIRVADVVAFATIPKSTLELHFRRETGHSIVREIQSVRLGKGQELLRSTNTPIALVAQRCGFGNDNYLKNVFKRKFGMTLTQFRRNH